MSQGSRRSARGYALQVLYSLELNPEAEAADIASTVTVKAEGAALAFADSIIRRVQEHKEELDKEISAHLRKWSLSQLNVVDKNILRIAAAELLFPEEEKIDKGVIINEAVELAKKFGGDASFRLVNGILNTVAREHQL